MYNDESYYLGNENMDFHVGKNFYPIKYSSNEKLSEVLRTTKSLIRNTDKYSSFIGKYKIQANPNLANSNDSNECFPSKFLIKLYNFKNANFVIVYIGLVFSSN